jgi:hypothetical protein
LSRPAASSLASTAKRYPVIWVHACCQAL